MKSFKTKIIALSNQKGGVGKTTSAVNIAAYLAVTETPTLLIDMDPQANATSGVGIEIGSYSKSIYDKAVLYQMFHTIAILLLGLLKKIQPELEFIYSGLAFLIGIIIFSGSLYILAITGIKSLGMITPIGGLLFIIGWVLLILKVIS